jgi:hypothetical protein
MTLLSYAKFFNIMHAHNFPVTKATKEATGQHVAQEIQYMAGEWDKLLRYYFI